MRPCDSDSVRVNTFYLARKLCNCGIFHDVNGDNFFLICYFSWTTTYYGIRSSARTCTGVMAQAFGIEHGGGTCRIGSLPTEARTPFVFGMPPCLLLFAPRLDHMTTANNAPLQTTLDGWKTSFIWRHDSFLSLCMWTYGRIGNVDQ